MLSDVVDVVIILNQQGLIVTEPDNILFYFTWTCLISNVDRANSHNNYNTSLRLADTNTILLYSQRAL